jgi:hypothetical protein
MTSETRERMNCVYEGRNRGWCVSHDYEWRIDSDVCEFMLLCVGSEFPHDTGADKSECPDCSAALAGLAVR